MDTDVPPSRMTPGSHYRVSYVRGPQIATVQGRYIGREVTAGGDQLVLAPTTTRVHIPLAAITRIQLVDQLPDESVKNHTRL